MSAKDAVFLLESNGLSVNMLGHGKVKSQSLAAGTEIHKGQVVKIVLE
jgi:cell division protein FtsI (penicillin-binding protein 3)